MLIVNHMRLDDKIYATLIRIQARFRGLLVRKKVKNVNVVNKRFMPLHDKEAPYKTVVTQRIVKI